jgi:hypothetical protein
MVSQAKRDANARYDDKTYIQVNARLRKDEDADIIASIEEAKKNGQTLREWLRDLFDSK